MDFYIDDTAASLRRWEVLLGAARPGAIAGVILLMIADVICWRGLTIVNPNTARVVLLFGRYQGTIDGCQNTCEANADAEYTDAPASETTALVRPSSG